MATQLQYVHAVNNKSTKSMDASINRLKGCSLEDTAPPPLRPMALPRSAIPRKGPRNGATKPWRRQLSKDSPSATSSNSDGLQPRSDGLKKGSPSAAPLIERSLICRCYWSVYIIYCKILSVHTYTRVRVRVCSLTKISKT